MKENILAIIPLNIILQVTKLNEVPGLIGRNGNYINYVASDTVLYIFVVNRKKQHLLTLPADSSLYTDIKEFRSSSLNAFPLRKCKGSI